MAGGWPKGEAEAGAKPPAGGSAGPADENGPAPGLAGDSTLPKEKGLPAAPPPEGAAGIENGDAAAAGAVLAGAFPFAPLNAGATAANGLIGKGVEGEPAGVSAGGGCAAIWKGEGWAAPPAGGRAMPKGEAGAPKPAALPLAMAGAAPFPCPSRALAMRPGSLAAGSGTVRGSCGETGVWNNAGQTRYSSNTGSAGWPPRSAFSSSAGGSARGCSTGSAPARTSSGGSWPITSPTVSGVLVEAVPATLKGDIPMDELIGGAATASGVAVLNRGLPPI